MLARSDADPALTALRDSVRALIASHVEPHIERWSEQKAPDRAFWRTLGTAGLLCPQADEDHGGAGLDFRYNAVIAEELGYVGLPPMVLVHSDIVGPYLIRHGSPAQQERWLPRMTSGDFVGAIAMTEQSAGSDLQAIRTRAHRQGGGWVINGAKTYITNGAQADLVIVMARTDPDAGSRGISLFLVETDCAGFSHGAPLEKVGQHCSDTTELFFDDVRVPQQAMLGGEGRGFAIVMQELAQERLAIAIYAQAAAQRAFDEALAYARSREAFGQPLLQFQNTRFVLADLKSELQIGWAHLDWAVARHCEGQLTSAEASAAKAWHTELQWRVCDHAVQLHGGAGYMREYPVSRMWLDARVTRIFGGTTEIMREVVARSL